VVTALAMSPASGWSASGGVPSAASAVPLVVPNGSPSPSATASPPGSPSPSASPTITPTPTPSSSGLCPPAVFTPESPVDPMPDPPPPSGNGASDTQDEISAVGGAILASVNANGYAGFAGLIATSSGLELHWLAGDPLPSDIAAIVASPPYPITVTRVDAPYGRAYLDSRATIITGSPSLGAQACGLVHTVVVPEEGNGLQVVAQPYTGVDPATFVSKLTPLLTAAAGVPVQVTVGPFPQDTVGRQAETAPWWAGARIKVGTSNCSSGFGVIRPNDTNKPYVLTAAHCFLPGATVLNGGAGAAQRTIGTVRDYLPGFDSEMIEINRADGLQSVTYTGAWDGAAFADVATTGVNIRGLLQFVCTDGASTGENCLLAIQNTDVRVLNPAFTTPARQQWTTNLVTAKPIFFRNIWIGTAVGAGDSGGPVVQYRTDGKVRAMGTMVAGSGVTRCGTVAPGVTCYGTVYYADINNLLNTYGTDLTP
jgi:hypothetical protein